MAKDPAVLFYTSDFLTGTITMTNEQVGAYIRLLCIQHQKGKLTEKDMLSICKAYDEDIFQKFTKHGEYYINQRMSEEAKKRSEYSESRKNNALGQKINKKAYAQHMENENINENTNTNINVIKGGAGGKTKSGWSSANDGKNMISPSGNKIPCDIFVLNNMAGDAEAAKIGLEIYEIYKKKRDAENIKGK